MYQWSSFVTFNYTYRREYITDTIASIFTFGCIFQADGVDTSCKGYKGGKATALIVTCLISSYQFII